MAGKNLTRIAYMDDRSQRQLSDLTRILAAADKTVLKAWRERAFTEIEKPLEAKIRRAMSAAAKYPEVADTVRARRGRKMAIWLGVGSGWPAEVALGTEFGGRKPRKVAYITRSRTGATRYIVNRRTTMQFWPHAGKRGHIMVPILRRDMPATVRKTVDICMDELLKMPGAREVRV